MKRKCLLFALLLVVGTSSLLAHDSDDHDHDHDDEDVIDIEDDLDNGAEEVEELKHETSAPPLPKVWLNIFPVKKFSKNYKKKTQLCLIQLELSLQFLVFLYEIS